MVCCVLGGIELDSHKFNVATINEIVKRTARRSCMGPNKIIRLIRITTLNFTAFAAVREKIMYSVILSILLLVAYFLIF